MDDFAGKSIGDYRILCRLAVGGSAEIFLAFSERGRAAFAPVVVKRLLSDELSYAVERDALQAEARLIAKLQHRNIAQLVKLVHSQHETLMALEFVDGLTVDQLLLFAAAHEPLPLGLSLGIVWGAAKGLGHAHAHRGSSGKPVAIIHRDVNPKNVMCSFSGVAKVLDFGIAKMLGSAARTSVGMVKGTTCYMSPEQTTGEALDARSDVFSLGIVLHELLTGQRLFSRSTAQEEMRAIFEEPIAGPSEINRLVPSRLNDLVMRALDRSLDSRLKDGNAFADCLEEQVKALVWSEKQIAQFLNERFAQQKRELTAILALIPQVSSERETTVQVSVPKPNEDEPLVPPTRIVSAAELRKAKRLKSESALNQGNDLLPKRARSPEFDPALPLVPSKKKRVAASEIRGTGKPGPLLSPVYRQVLVFSLAAFVTGALVGGTIYKFFQVASTPAATARLELVSKTTTQVSIGNRQFGQTPLEIMLPPGHHEIKFTSDLGVKYAQVDLFERSFKKLEVTW
jgi:serine/threonine protein kinase